MAIATRSAAWVPGMVAFVHIVVATFFLEDATAVAAAVLRKGDLDDLKPASIAVTNVMDIGGGVNVSVHCHTAQQDLGTAVIVTGLTYTLPFTYDPAVNVPYICQFLWLGGTDSQSFAAWTHDGRSAYLAACDDCLWKIENDGFYIHNSADQVFYKMYPWTTEA